MDREYKCDNIPQCEYNNDKANELIKKYTDLGFKLHSFEAGEYVIFYVFVKDGIVEQLDKMFNY